MMRNIDGVNIDDVLTDYIPSILVSKSGRVALAPVIGDIDESKKSQQSIINFNKDRKMWEKNNLISTVASYLPPPLDLALLADVDPRSPISIIDRLSGIGLLAAWADFNQEDRVSWERYDKFSADELFKSRAGVTDGLYEEFISPLLHVLPMTPGYDCSAAAALSCFHVFALQTKGAFDVRWGRGSLSELIFNPWIKQLLGRGNFQIKGGCKVSSIDKHSSSGDNKESITINIEGEEDIKCDAVVLAVGANSCAKLVSQSPSLKELDTTKNFDDLRGITCVAVRLFLKPSAATLELKEGSTELPSHVADAMRDSPVVVVGPDILPELKETGFCIYDLQRMHDEFAYNSTSAESNVAVIEVDFFRADSIADKDDDEVINLTLQAISAALKADKIDSSLVVDSAVFRARKAVSHFNIGSASLSPDTILDENIFICGDWIDRTGHASWSTEKAVVTAKKAAKDVLAYNKLNTNSICILDVTEESDELKSLRNVAQILRETIPSPINDGGIPPSPWSLANLLTKNLGK